VKTLLRTAAVFSFLFFLVAGGCILSQTLSSPASDAIPQAAIGFVFVGAAFFVGPMLLFAAERVGRKDGSQ